MRHSISVIVPDARWEITSCLTPLLEDKGLLVGGCNRVEQGPLFKAPLNLLIALFMLHPLGFFNSSCERVAVQMLNVCWGLFQLGYSPPSFYEGQGENRGRSKTRGVYFEIRSVFELTLFGSFLCCGA